jgi:aminoglycoside/choline kinase family phosphotransferase
MTDTHASDDSAASERRRIDQYLRDSGLVAPGHRVVALTSDASTRRYYRVIPTAGPTAGPAAGPAPGPSIVLALHEDAIEFATLPFVNVARLLHQIPLPVPAVIGHSDALGILALQDLGDVTLQAHVGASRPTEHAALYRQAVAFIASLQQRGAELTSAAHTPYGIAFDVEKLTWELDFFVRHFVEGYRGASLSESERIALAEEWAAIAGELAAEPRVLCHRDYHSRNLMVHEGGLFIIDFQDARMGPDTYDLASLLRDSYVDISESELDDLIAYFLAVAGHSSAGAFRRRFDLTAVQRNLKALGTFGHQTTARHNAVYIQYMPRTLHYVRANLEKYPRFARLRELLASHIEEFR